MHIISSSEMHRINRFILLEVIRRQGPISRAEIARQLRVSLPMVMRIVDELIQDGLVIPTGGREWSGGRKRPLVAFNAAGRLTIGIDLGGTKIYGSLADLGGNVLYEARISHHQSTGEESYQRLAGLVRDLQKFAQSTHASLSGIGVGAPGVTLYEQGIVQFAPSLGWRDFPLKQRLVQEFNLPVVVDNDVNLAALGELWFGAGQGAHSLVVIAVGTGIGCGIVLDGAIYRGVHQAAGEIGYLIPDRNLLGQSYQGFGALEQLASGTGIAQRARQRLEGQWSDEKLHSLTAEDVFSAARRQAPWAQEIVAETVDYLAQGIAAINLCFDPEIIVLGGGVARSGDLLIEPILQRLGPNQPVLPRLVPSTLGYRATVLGAITDLLYHTTGFYTVQRMS